MESIKWSGIYSVNIPEIDNHKMEHKKFVEKITAFKSEFQSGKSGLTMEVFYFLKDWLNHHILEIDKATGKYLTSSK